MSPSDVAVRGTNGPTAPRRIVNDFSIQVATVNGSGSQTANLVLLRSIFQMGVPVSGKNMFPSNIAGLPTWYTIRANKHGYISRKKEIDFLVAMNPETAREDVLSLEAGAAVLYDEPLKLSGLRDDLVFYPVPFDKIVAEVCKDAKLRRLVKNMIYDGVLSRLIHVDLGQMEHALRRQLGKKTKRDRAQPRRARGGRQVRAADHLSSAIPTGSSRPTRPPGMILVEGNVAGALGCMMAGVTVVAWYPITPSSSLPEALIGFMKKYRIDKETGKATYAIVQAEDEIASIGMVVGAGWAGARAMTSTSGPGISLMGEFAGLAYYAEVPGVVWNIQRVGPSTGLPTRTAQGDILSTAMLSHGDTRQIMLLPASPEECYTDGDGRVRSRRAFPDAGLRDERPRSRDEHLDGDAVQVSGRAARSRQGARRGDDWHGSGEWGRYKDVDGDGIPYRTIPGTGMPAYFTRGSGHNERGLYSERPDDYTHNVDRLARKFETAQAIRAAADSRRARRRADRDPRLRLQPLGNRRKPGSNRGRGRPRTGLPAAAGVSVYRGRRGLHRSIRSCLRRRAEPGRADARRSCGWI